MKSVGSKECFEALEHANRGVDDALRKIVHTRARPPVHDMYRMLSYSLGFLDVNLKPSHGSAKRLRPGLCLFIAEGYGARAKAFDAALAIELFHNFTLIHDDVEDGDETRRNKPTLWKKWGINHAINSGDAQLVIAAECAFRAGTAASTLLQAFLEVFEGQYLDFELATMPLTHKLVTEKMCMNMGGKKTGTLIAVAAEAAGIVSGQNAKECERLHAYGMALGMAFQIADDYNSVWNSQQVTGKDSHSDIREHKRTLPFFFARAHAQSGAKTRLEHLYSLDRPLNEKEVMEAKQIIDATPARLMVQKRVAFYAKKAKTIVYTLHLPVETKAILVGAAEMLVPKEE